MRLILMLPVVPTDGSAVPVWTIWTPTPGGGGPFTSSNQILPSIPT